MDVMLKAAGAVLVTSVMGLALGKDGQNFRSLLTLGCCALVLLLGVSFLQPVLSFLRELEEMGNLDRGLVSVLMKVTGICLISRFAGMVCTEAGDGSLAKVLEMLAAIVILWLSIPVFRGLLTLIEGILGGI